MQHPPPKLCFIRQEWDGSVGCSSCLWEGENHFRAGSSKDFVKTDSKQVNSGLVEPALHPSVALHGGDSIQSSASQSCDASPDWDGLGRSLCPAHRGRGCVYSAGHHKSLSLPQHSLATAQTLSFEIKITAATSGLLLLPRLVEKPGLFQEKREGNLSVGEPGHEPHPGCSPKWDLA